VVVVVVEMVDEVVEVEEGVVVVEAGPVVLVIVELVVVVVSRPKQVLEFDTQGSLAGASAALARLTVRPSNGISHGNPAPPRVNPAARTNPAAHEAIDRAALREIFAIRTLLSRFATETPPFTSNRNDY
jgi:hypothetical protein